MTARTKPAESPREQYYAELESLEPDERLQEAIQAARESETQQRLLETWRRTTRPRHT